jgi:predicted DCC family thiol-disulfide oxidoreductase YuxK
VIATVCYDADCGLCRWCAWQLRRWDRRGRLRFVPIGDPRADALLHDLGPERRRASWHVVSADRRVTSAGAAIPRVLELLPGGWPLAAVADRLPATTERAYRWVAARRERIGRMLGGESCAVDPDAPRPAGARSITD